MKKSILFALVLLVATSMNAVPRKHLLEHFTTAQCGYCPGGYKEIVKYTEAKSNVVWVCHHAGYGKDDYTTTEASQLCEFLNVPGAPYAVFDRAPLSPLTSGTNVAFNALIINDYPVKYIDTTYASLQIENTYSAATRQLAVHVTGAVEKEDVTSLKLTALVKESGMLGPQNDYEYTFTGKWLEYTHVNTPRKYLSNALGDVLDVTSGTIDTTYTITLNSKWVADNMSVVCFLTEASGKNVIQAEQEPVVSGTKGGQDIQPGGVTAEPVSETYPEDPRYTLQSTLKKDIVRLEEVNTSYQDFSGGVRVWYIEGITTKQYSGAGMNKKIPYMQVAFLTSTSQKALPTSGTYTFTDTEEIGTALMGIRDDVAQQIYGSNLYLISLSEYQQGYLEPACQWLIGEGSTLRFQQGGFEIIGQSTMIETPLHIVYGTATDVEHVEANDAVATKVLRDGQLLIQRGGKTYDVRGAVIE